MEAFINSPLFPQKYHINNQNRKISISVKAQLQTPQPYINSKRIKEVREKYRVHEKDTGSPEYQIAALTVRIEYMTVHVKKNPKDYASTRGLIAMVSARKKLLSYLRAQNKDRFLKLCVNLKIRIQKSQL
mmetsp:Transcript_3539/g.7294  ORF Transcript_3539/g.7294 Transcript_3539/m.7294 type:complete len:130 (+) Transcript_3539:62-451(+)